jgi:hypothetical protein
VLPHLVAQWDVCLLPFARNESTRFISPTKTLEYMAAEKSIVSTPIHDVISLYGDSVAIADTAGEFISACARALAETEPARRQRIERMRKHIGQCTWSATARQIVAEIEAVLERQHEVTSSIDNSPPLLRPVPAHAVESQRRWPADRATADVAMASLAAP